jgi:hypothetical protein
MKRIRFKAPKDEEPPIAEPGLQELMDAYLESLEPDLEEEAEPWLVPDLDEVELRVWRRRAKAKETARLDHFFARMRREGLFGEWPFKLEEYAEVIASALIDEYEALLRSVGGPM